MKNVLLVGAERPRTHHDVLAVIRQHQQVIGLTLGWGPLGVVGLDVDGGPVGELLELSFPDFLAGGPPIASWVWSNDPRARLERRKPPDSVGLPFGGQVQRRVGGVQVRPLRGAVGQPVDLHGSEHRQQLTGVPRLARARWTPSAPVTSGRGSAWSVCARSVRWSCDSCWISSRPLC